MVWVQIVGVMGSAGYQHTRHKHKKDKQRSTVRLALALSSPVLVLVSASRVLGSWHMVMLTNRPVACREEICFDYGPQFWAHGRGA